MKIIREKLGAHISNYTLGEISTLNDQKMFFFRSSNYYYTHTMKQILNYKIHK